MWLNGSQLSTSPSGPWAHSLAASMALLTRLPCVSITPLGLHLPSGQGSVGRDADRAGREEAHVGGEPLDAVLGQNADTVAPLNARFQKRGGASFGFFPVE